VNTRTRGVLLGLLSGAAAAVVAEAVRPRGPAGRPIDWDEVKRLTERRVATGLTAVEARHAADGYNHEADAVLEPLLEAVGGLRADVTLPPFQALDRASWIDLNLDIMSRVVEPLLEANPIPSSLLLDVGRAGIDRYLAILLDFLSRRVLGQFDPNLLGREPITADTTGLYLVEPNVAAWEREAGLDGAQLRRWLILHESTHAWQFLGHPWLREHLNAMVEEVLAMAGRSSTDPVRRVAGMFMRIPSQLGVVRRMQATMTLIEGYSNLVMDVVGREVLPDFERLEQAYQDRAGKRSSLEMLFWRATGLDLKLRQYEVGERFCVAVHAAHGMQALNLAWTSPEHLPRADEFGEPEAWYRRVSTLG
jgi:coenzyme F420 biosynthesis associated uncharacterized protein